MLARPSRPYLEGLRKGSMNKDKRQEEIKFNETKKDQHMTSVAISQNTQKIPPLFNQSLGRR